MYVNSKTFEKLSIFNTIWKNNDINLQFVPDIAR